MIQEQFGILVSDPSNPGQIVDSLPIIRIVPRYGTDSTTYGYNNDGSIMSGAKFVERTFIINMQQLWNNIENSDDPDLITRLLIEKYFSHLDLRW